MGLARSRAARSCGRHAACPEKPAWTHHATLASQGLGRSCVIRGRDADASLELARQMTLIEETTRLRDLAGGHSIAEQLLRARDASICLICVWREAHFASEHSHEVVHA